MNENKYSGNFLLQLVSWHEEAAASQNKDVVARRALFLACM
jgi:hypothetical protein